VQAGEVCRRLASVVGGANLNGRAPLSLAEQCGRMSEVARAAEAIRTAQTTPTQQNAAGTWRGSDGSSVVVCSCAGHWPSPLRTGRCSCPASSACSKDCSIKKVRRCDVEGGEGEPDSTCKLGTLTADVCLPLAYVPAARHSAGKARDAAVLCEQRGEPWCLPDVQKLTPKKSPMST
jgi:hypothetical protein